MIRPRTGAEIWLRPWVAGLAAVCAPMVVVVFAAGCGGDDRRAGLASDDGASGTQTSTSGADPGSGAAAAGKSAGLGTLRVQVLWPEADARARTPAGRNPCGQMRRAPVTVHTLGGLAGAVVEVRAQGQADADRGRTGLAAAPDEPETDSEAWAGFAIAGCRPEPRVVLASAADRRVAVCNHDRDRRQVRWTTTSGDPAIGSASLALVGACASFDMPGAGVWRVHTAADEDEPGYAYVPTSERVALTNERGAAVFQSLPAGDYEVRVWHPPATATGTAVERSQRVAITGSRTAELMISMAEP